MRWVTGVCTGCAGGPGEQGRCRPAYGGVGGAFEVVNEWNYSSFRCRFPGTSASWAERQRRGEESQISSAPRYPQAVRRGLTTGSFSKAWARAQRCRCPKPPGYPAKERIPKPDPKAGQVWTTASFSSTVHGAFFFGKTKKNGGCIPRLPVGGRSHAIMSSRFKNSTPLGKTASSSKQKSGAWSSGVCPTPRKKNTPGTAFW